MTRWEDRRHGSKIIALKARLWFSPDGEDNFTIRGGSKTVLYKGGNVSHRLTLHGKDSFEYDVILKKPLASNVVSLTLKGAENFDFFRQLVSAGDPFLSGSYAVYLKETFIGQGTSKGRQRLYPSPSVRHGRLSHVAFRAKDGHNGLVGNKSATKL
jgi:hypothetical protein